jgi:hypothetical protein
LIVVKPFSLPLSASSPYVHSGDVAAAAAASSRLVADDYFRVCFCRGHCRRASRSSVSVVVVAAAVRRPND